MAEQQRNGVLTMKRLISGLFLVIMVCAMLPASESQSAPQWGWPTHHLIAEQAIEGLDAGWQDVFDALISVIKGGSILPDTWHDLGDTLNHLYYPDTQYGSAPTAVETWYTYFVDNLTAGNYYDGILAAAVMSHYYADVNIPVHTGPYWAGHSAYETDINNHLADLTIGTITINESIGDVKQFTSDAAIHSSQYYDDIVDAYPNGDTRGPVVDDADIKALTEEQLTRAISGLASLWTKGLEGLSAPTVDTSYDYKALVDLGHDNDYSDGLKNIQSYLRGIGYETITDNDGITETDLAGVDFLVVTALASNYTQAELTVVKDWVQAGNRSIFVTGRGDFNNISHAGINDLLAAIGTVIRVNDDNVYTVSSDPNYYRDWYIYTDNIVTPGNEPYVDGAEMFNLFSPNSLYFNDTSDNLKILVNGSKYNYQSDENSPPPTVVWDDTDDGNGGTTIPLVASETLNDDSDRIVVFGDTSFSDFSFAPSSFHDNEVIIPTIVEWTLFYNIGSGYDFLDNQGGGTTTTNTSTTNDETSTTSWSFAAFALAIGAAFIVRRKQK